MFHKFSLSQLFVMQTAVTSHQTYLGNLISSGKTTTDSNDPAVRAESMVKLGGEYAEAQGLVTDINIAITDKQIKAKAKAEAKAVKKAAKETANVA